MDPEGYFSGNTLTASWKSIERADRYSVGVEQCDDQAVRCNQVFHKISRTTDITETASDFAPCTIYNLKLVALSRSNDRLMKESVLLRKSYHECGGGISEVILIGIAALIVVLIIGASGLLIYYHKKRPFQRIQRARSRVYSRIYTRDKYERPYSREEFLRRIPDYLDLRDLNDDEATIDTDNTLANEFNDLERLAFDTIQRKISSSSPPVNRRRNRYADIVPFDKTRVKLQVPLSVQGEEEASDYINASFITDFGYSSPRQQITSVRLSNTNGSQVIAENGESSPASPLRSKGYIAAQGPGPETAPLFWEMIWQQNVRIIVMLTKLVEGFGYNSVKCSMYWPHIVGATKRFNNIEVQLYDCQEAPDYVVRKLDVSNLSSSASSSSSLSPSSSVGGQCNREIVHIQYTSWPDRSAPDQPDALIQLIKVVRVLTQQYNDSQNPGPILVHCSAGVGRSGTYIAVDQLMKMIDDPSFYKIDIFNLVYRLRKERRYMVQTLAQYVYVYSCVYEYLKNAPKVIE